MTANQIKPYRLKHLPTGLYYQPHRHRGSNLSEKGKVYLSKGNALSPGRIRGHKTFSVWVDKNSRVHKLTKDKLEWTEDKYNYGQLFAETNFNDWVKEEL